MRYSDVKTCGLVCNLCGGDKTVNRTACTSDIVTDSVGETGVAAMAETLANPHH